MTVDVEPVAPPRPVTPLGIVAATLADLCRRLADGDADVLSDLRRAHAIVAGLDPYLERCTTPESAALRRLADRTASEDWAGRPGGLEQEMLSGHVEGQFLAFLVHLGQARRVLDIGMFTGYSALAMAQALPADGVVVACEIDAEVAAFARRNFADSRGGHRIDIRVGPAVDTLSALAAAGERFDLVFLDADKAGYLDYLDAVLRDGLLADHGVVCVDNTLLQGQSYGSVPPTANGAAIAAFNEAVAADPRVEQVVLPLRDGITLIRPVVR